GGFYQNGVEYHFLPSTKKKPRFPFHFHKTIKSLEPDIVIVLGLHFPLQLLQLRRVLDKKTKIIARHHADAPPKGIRKLLQGMADHSIDAYLFTSAWHAQGWVDAGIIKNKNKIHEVFEASTDFTRQDKELSKLKTGMKGNDN